MRILMVSDVYFPRINGVSTAIQTLRRELQRAGHGVTLIAPSYGVCSDPADDHGPVYRIGARRVWNDPEDRMMSATAVHRLLPVLAQARFDLVHVHTPFVAYYTGKKIARSLRLPLVETYHTFFEEYLYHYVPLLPRAFMRELARTFSRRQCQDVDGLVVPSEPMQRRLRDYGVSTPMTVIPTGIELHDFASGDGARFRERHGIAANRPVLLYVGRVAHEKNVAFLLHMLARVRIVRPDALLVIAGEGPGRASLEAQTRSLGLADNVMFAGYLDRRTELPDCYRAADLFVFASRTETQGLVLLEAMASGLPVVGLAVMGTADVLKHGQGAWVAEDDVADFATKVLTLLDDNRLRATLAERAVEYVRGWTAAELSARLVEFYEQTVLRHDAVAVRRTGWRAEAVGRAAPRR